MATVSILGVAATLAAGAVLAASPALAQGTFNNGRAPATGFGAPSSAPTGTYRPAYPAPPASRTRSPGAEAPGAAPTFKPYEPYRTRSVYGSPSAAPAGAKPCETSVYVNACGRNRR